MTKSNIISPDEYLMGKFIVIWKHVTSSPSWFSVQALPACVLFEGGAGVVLTYARLFFFSHRGENKLLKLTNVNINAADPS